MGEGYLLDTNAIIDFSGGKLPAHAMQKMKEIINTDFNISAVVKIEALSFNGPKDDMQKLEDLLKWAKMFYIDDNIIEKTIDLRKVYKNKLGDAIIAATALTYDLDLISRNLKDFKDIPYLKVIDPYTL